MGRDHYGAAARYIRVASLLALAGVLGLATLGWPAKAAEQPPLGAANAAPPEAVPPPAPSPPPVAPRCVLQGPLLSENPQAPPIEPAQPAATDQVLPINLATALYLSNARPLVIAFAQAGVEVAAARLQHADVFWLPNFNIGFDYYRHDGTDQTTEGNVITDSKNALAVGGGATLVFGLTDAIFLPLVARQELSARQFDVQAARNDALLTVAAAYFDVQQARGQLAANLDVETKAEELVTRITSLARGLTPEIEVDRARALLADVRQQVAASRYAWRVASARLTRVLRLNPSSMVVPLEPPHLQVTLISPRSVVDDLVPIGLLNRPELASRKALVQLTLERLRQERIRPLVPSLVLLGRTGPGGAFEGGLFGGGTNDRLDQMGGRFDMDISAVWTLNNLGFGNRALVRERAAQEQAALIDLFNIQDQVAEEVVQAQAQLEQRATQIAEAETAVKEAIITFRGNLIGIGQTRIAGDLLLLVNRPQEAVAALQQLSRAYEGYYLTINGYNRAEFQLYHALGFPSRILAAERPAGPIQAVDLRRLPPMEPVCPEVVADPRR